MEQRASLWKLFGVFAKIGAFTIGGGYVMIPVIEAEMRKRKWVPDDELEDIVVLAQSAPGLLAVNMAIFTGHRIRGTKGSIVATLGAIAPSFFIILLIAILFSNFKENDLIRRLFQGIRPVAVALILSPAINMFRKGWRKWWWWTLMLLSATLVAFMKVSPVWILLVLIVLAIGFTALKEGRRR